jgi:hypothetical protein
VPEADGELSAFDLCQWRMERERELPTREALSKDRLYRVIVHLQTARSVVDLRDREIKRLEEQLRYCHRQEHYRFSEIKRLQKQLVASSARAKRRKGGS